MLSNLDHVQLAMPPGEEDALRRFCIDLLGLQEMVKPQTLITRGGAWFVLPDGMEIHYGVQEDFAPARKAHPAFASGDLDQLAARLAGAGYPVKWDEALAPRRRFYSSDPFGNRLEFLEPARVGPRCRAW